MRLVCCAALAVLASAGLARASQFVAKRDAAFVVKLHRDDGVILAINGPLRVEAHCSLGLVESGNVGELTDAAEDGYPNLLTFVAVSQDKDWYATGEDPEDLGQERVLFTAQASAKTLEVGPVGLSAVSASGDVIGLDVLNVGSELFGFDCFASGTIRVLNARE
jgi:hypothetical protein